MGGGYGFYGGGCSRYSSLPRRGRYRVMVLLSTMTRLLVSLTLPPQVRVLPRNVDWKLGFSSRVSYGCARKFFAFSDFRTGNPAMKNVAVCLVRESRTGHCCQGFLSQCVIPVPYRSDRFASIFRPESKRGRQNVQHDLTNLLKII